MADPSRRHGRVTDRPLRRWRRLAEHLNCRDQPRYDDLDRDPRNDRVAVKEWHEKWWPVLNGSDLADNTLASYESTIRLRILPGLGSRPMASLRRIDIKTWLVEKRDAGISGEPLGKIKSLLGRLFTWSPQGRPGHTPWSGSG